MTKAMILASGRGTRMRELTRDCPKPLLQACGKSLIEHNIDGLKQAGINTVVINTYYLGHMIREKLGDGTAVDVCINYAIEDHGKDMLGTGGGVKNALKQLGDAPFLLVSADIWTDYPLKNLLKHAKKRQLELLVVPAETPGQGDFCLGADGRLSRQGTKNVTFAGIGMCCPSYFSEVDAQTFGLMTVIEQAMRENKCFGHRLVGRHLNVGTPELLQALEAMLLPV